MKGLGDGGRVPYKSLFYLLTVTAGQKFRVQERARATCVGIFIIAQLGHSVTAGGGWKRTWLTSRDLILEVATRRYQSEAFYDLSLPLL